MKKIKQIYLDSASNTPLDRRVFSVMKPFLAESFVGNSHSIHEFGIKAHEAIENARTLIATAAGFSPEEVYFTSGATESNNWVLKSLAFHELFEEKHPKKHLVVSAIEHASVLNTCHQLEKMGFSITYVKPTSDGKIPVLSVKKALRFDTLLVCVMAVNNETGAENNIIDIGKAAHANKSLMMSDCTQFLSEGGIYCQLNKRLPNVDYYTFSGHKIYGPTGTGCLIVRKKAPLYSFITGGGQEFGLRGGTSNTSGIVGLGKAYLMMAARSYHSLFESLHNYLIESLLKNNIPFKINGVANHPNIINLNFSMFMNDSELASLLSIYGIACSAGSACEAASGNEIQNTPSHVLVAMGIPEREIYNSVRLSFSKYTTKQDIDKFVKVMKKLKEQSEATI